MKRSHYDPWQVAALVGELGKAWPLMGLGADFIAGFPGETAADLEILLDFVNAMPFTYAHVFPYSRRQGTAAAAMPGQIARAEKERRAQLIRNAVCAKRKQFLERLLDDCEMRVVFEKAEAGGDARGVNQYYAQCRCRSGNVVSGRLARVRPVGLADGFIEVEPLPA